MSAATSLREKVPYPFMTSTESVEYLVDQMLYSMRKPGENNAELNLRIETAYNKRFGVKMLAVENSHAEPTCLHGTPGQGKTTATRAASKIVAEMLKMKLVVNPHPPYVPQKNDLVVVTLEMSGEVSNIIMGGIPIADKIHGAGPDPIQFMNKLPMYQLGILKHAGAAVLILDDFVNAAAMVQNVALSIAQEGRFQGLDLGNTYVTLTANLGALDNTDVNPLSGAMTSRVGHFYIEDTPADFIERAQSAYPDGLADCGVSSFLALRNDLFTLDSESDGRIDAYGIRQPFPCSRSYDKLINTLRITVNRIGGDMEKVSIMGLERTASAFIGKFTAKALASHLYAIMTGAEPLARDLIKTGELDVFKFESKYGKGLDAKSQDFGYQMAFSLANHASAAIAEGKDPKEVIARMSKALFKLDTPTMVTACAAFSGRIKALLKEKACTMDNSGRPLLLLENVVFEYTGALGEGYRAVTKQSLSKETADEICDAITGADRRAELFNAKINEVGQAQKKASPAP